MKGSGRKRVAVVVLLLLLAALGWWFWNGDRPSGPVTGRSVDPRFLAPAAPETPEETPAPVVPVLAGDASPNAPSVTVLDPEGAPVEGAKVEFLPLAATHKGLNEVVAVGSTDANGRAVLTESRWSLPGLVRATHPSYAPADRLVAEGVTEVVLRLNVPTWAAGVVVDEFDQPVANADVELQCVQNLHSLGTFIGHGGVLKFATRTGDDGRFRFGGLPQVHTNFLVCVRTEGFTELRTRGTQTGAGSEMRLVLHRDFRSIIRLVDPEGTPLPNGTVGVFEGKGRVEFSSFYGMGLESEWLPFHREGDGTYTRSGLPPGWYTCLASHPGTRPRVMTVGLERRRDEPLDIVMDGVKGVACRVVDAETKSPLAGVQVLLLPPSRWQNAQGNVNFLPTERLRTVSGPFVTVSDSKGEFLIAIADPGDELQVLLFHDRYNTSGANLRNRGTSQPMEFSMVPRDDDIAIHGRIVDGSGAPLPHALLRWQGGVASTGPDGRFSIDAVMRGDVISVEASDYFPLSVRIHQQAPGEQKDWVMTPLRRLRGRVVDTDGNPVRRHLLAEALSPLPPGDSSNPLFVRPGHGIGASDGDGHVTLPVVPGIPYRVKTNPHWDPSDLAEVTVPAEGDEPFTLVVAVKPPRGETTIRGRLELEGGGWIGPRAFVNLLTADRRNSLGSAEVEMDGAFQIHNVPQGTWDLHLSGATEGFKGALRGLVVPASGVIEVVLPCVPDGAGVEAPSPVHIRVRPNPGESDEGPRRLRGWMVDENIWSAAALRPEPDGLYGAMTWPGQPVSIYLYDPIAARAALMADVDTKATVTLDLPMLPSGQVLVPRTMESFNRILRVRSATGALLLHVRTGALPGHSEEVSALHLPPGAYEISASDDETTEGTRHRIVVTAGESQRLP